MPSPRKESSDCPQTSKNGAGQSDAIKDAFAIACSKPTPSAEPLDWLETTCSRRWKLGGGTTVDFPWMPTEGPWPFSD